MMTLSSSSDKWVKFALKNDTLVVELLLDLKHSSNSDSFKTATIPLKDVTTPLRMTLLPPPRWSNQKIRSKSSNKEHHGSPTTHLSWSGGGCSGSDGVSNMSYGARSVKANEGASTSSYNNKSLKRKTFVDLKDEEGSLFKGRIHVNKVSLNNQELTSKRVTLNHQSATTNENVKRIKVDPDQKLINKMGSMGEHERQTKVPPLANQSVKISIRVEAKTEAPQRGFVLLDLNMIPNEEDLMAMS
ncbi:hypothetical protein Tco_0374646 [Tanacetum coccineum]